MENVQTVIALVFAFAVMFFVPALVWATVIVGLYQLIRDKIHEIRLARRVLRPAVSDSPVLR